MPTNPAFTPGAGPSELYAVTTLAPATAHALLALALALALIGFLLIEGRILESLLRGASGTAPQPEAA